MLKKTVALVNESGLQTGPTAQFVKLANTFQSHIKVFYKGRTSNAKSTLEMMLANAAQGEEITIQADGVDETQAIAALEQLVASGFKG